MCYTGTCSYESYPYGSYEGCECRKPAYTPCPLDEEEEEEEDAQA